MLLYKRWIIYKSFIKALNLSINNNCSCGKLFLSFVLPVIFDGNLKVTSVSFFDASFNLSSSEYDSFRFPVLHWVFLYWYYAKLRKICICEFKILLQTLEK